MQNLIKKWFERKITLEKIDDYCSHIKVKKKKFPEDIYPETICVSCVQRTIQPVKRVEKYIDMLCGFLEQAAKNKSTLVVFPEYNFIDLFGLIPGFTFLNQILNKSAVIIKNKAKNYSSKKNNHLLANIFKSTAKPIEVGMKRMISLLAQKYDMYIYSGTFILKEGEKFYNAGSLFAPDGRLIGTQKKLHLTDFEVDLGMERGLQLEAYSLKFARVACPVCMDATYFETFRIARNMGTDIVILPIANLEEYNMWKALRGIWPRVQESYLYGLKSSLNGWIAGMHFTGQAGIFAPLSLTKKRDGVLSISSFPEGNELVTANINVGKLHEARRLSEYHEDKNIEFEKKYEKEVYID